MVAATIPLPNIRRFFVPDPGYMLVDADLAGADAQVVAWEADDVELKKAFRAGLKLHIKNARDVFPTQTQGMTDTELKQTDRPGGIYHDCKRMVHATNYVGSAQTIAETIGRPIHAVKMFQHTWLVELHPGIKEWHDRIETRLQNRRTVYNKFGYRIVYFNRVQGLLPQAVAWIAQSTVALTCNRGGLQIRREYPWLQLLLQVHDSLVFQIPISKEGQLDFVRKSLNVEIAYSDPLTIPWGMKTSRQSWGDIE